jgi:phage-related protein
MSAQRRNELRITVTIAALTVAMTLIPAGVAAQIRGGNITPGELQVFDNFLDSHPAIDRDLRQDPTLAKNPAYLNAHADLRTFLQTHPRVQAEINSSPRFFVRREEAFDRFNRDITLAEIRSLDAFLDEHPDIENDLRRDPGLIRDSRYLASHPALRDYLNRHPAVAADLRESPRTFMWRERMLDRQQRGGPGRGGDITQRELQVFDNFLDSNPAIDRDLREDPTLAKNPTYLAAHPELRAFLQTHPGVQAEINKSPRFFVRRAEAFDRSNKDITLAEARSLDAFLDDHPDIESDLRKNPALVRDSSYLASHPAFKDYLNRHPAVAADLRESPRAFMWQESMLDRQRQQQRGAQGRGLARGNPNPPARGVIETRGRGPQPQPAPNPPARGRGLNPGPYIGGLRGR